ncbi:MAG: agmatinase family protein [Phycisphaerales bacterium]|nr:agmatinase family protein [Phycisphaerales bacterium]
MYDPDGPIAPDSSLFGLPHSFEEAHVIVIPVPFDATVSYGHGCAGGPGAIRRASCQLDLLDQTYGPIHERGIHMLEIDDAIRQRSIDARAMVGPFLERGEIPGAEIIERVDAICEEVRLWVRSQVARVLGASKLPIVLGGEHAVSLGAIEACTEGPAPATSILQIDAHMDLRQAYEGLRHSHASVMWNALDARPDLRLVQVGIRDSCEAEHGVASQERVSTFFDETLARASFGGAPFGAICDRILEDLGETVYVTVDIDGLDPSLCPHTGTPVPGGLSFRELMHLLGRVFQERTVVGCDLVEVGDDEWDGNVGARVLYRLCAANMKV